MKNFILKLLFLTIFFAIKLNLSFLSGLGTSGGLILSQPIGARASGMGEAYTTASGDVMGIHYNPASLSGLKSKQLSLVYQRGIIKDNFSVVSFGMPVDIGAIAVSLIYYNAGDIELIDLDGQEKTVNAQTDFLGTISFSRDFGKLCLGTNIKILSSKLVESVKATTIAADIGSNYQINERIMLGLSIKNIGEKLKYLDVGDNLPLTIRGGIFYKILDAESLSLFAPPQSLLAASDIVKINDDDKIKCNVGLEYTLYTNGGGIFVRSGYKIGYKLDGLTFGVGFAERGFSIDYALSPVKEFETVHRVSFTYRFGQIE